MGRPEVDLAKEDSDAGGEGTDQRVKQDRNPGGSKDSFSPQRAQRKPEGKGRKVKKQK
jgi:hypothetical protein